MTIPGQGNDALRGGKRRVPCHTNRQDGVAIENLHKKEPIATNNEAKGSFYAKK